MSAKCHITIAHLENEIQKHHNTTTNVPAHQIIVAGSFDVKSAVYCMLCICGSNLINKLNKWNQNMLQYIWACKNFYINLIGYICF